MKHGLVSTVIPVHQRAALLRRAVASVLSQSWDECEIIVVDDGSRDDTPEVARQLALQHPGVVRVVEQQNAGPGVARQRGLALARGEFVQFLDSDDVLLPGKFSLQVAALRAQPAAGIAYGKTRVMQGGRAVPHLEPRALQAQRHVFPALLGGRLWDTGAPLYRRAALDRIGPWPAKRQMEDWEFDAQAGAAGIELVFCDEFVCEYHLHTGPRLAHVWTHDDRAMQDRLDAHLRIHAHAVRAGVAENDAHMQRWARTLFAVAREAAQRGLRREAMELLQLAASIRKEGRIAPDIALYRGVVRVLGWKAAAVLDRLGEWKRSAVGAH